MIGAAGGGATPCAVVEEGAEELAAKGATLNKGSDNQEHCTSIVIIRRIW